MGCTCQQKAETPAAGEPVVAAAEPVIAAAERWEEPVFVDQGGPVRMGSVGNPQSPCHPKFVRMERYEAGRFVAVGESTLPQKAQDRMACSGGACLPWVRVTRDPKKFEACFAAAQAHGPIEDAAHVDRLLRPFFEKEDQEVFVVMCLDVQRQVRSVSEIARGLRDRVEVGVPDVLRIVLIEGASYIVVAHNHPSGRVDPSESDLELTASIVEASSAVHVDFMDHIIIAAGGYYSFAEKGHLPLKKRRKSSAG